MKGGVGGCGQGGGSERREAWRGGLEGRLGGEAWRGDLEGRLGGETWRGDLEGTLVVK